MLYLPENTYFRTCDKYIQKYATTIEDIGNMYYDFHSWWGPGRFTTKLKPALYAHLNMLEYLYPVSTFCFSTNGELITLFEKNAQIMSTANGSPNTILLLMNGLKNFGSLLKDIMAVDDCFRKWDGKCAGEALGGAFLSLMNPDIIPVLADLYEDEYSMSVE